MEPTREFFIDQRIESYGGFVPDEWAPGFFSGVKPKSVLDKMLVDFVLAWRTTSYIASMPSTLIKTVLASTLAYAKYTSPDSSLISFGEKVLAEMSTIVPELVENRELRMRLLAALATSADAFRSRRDKAMAMTDMPVQQVWEDFLRQPAFWMTVSASQRVAYVAFYNAYEALLVDCTKLALRIDQLRAIDKPFVEGLRTAFGSDLTGPCWGCQEIQIGREVRHALSHAGGRETNKLKKLKHGIELRDGVLQIVPGDNHKLLRGLRKGVNALVELAIALPQLQAAT